MGLALILIILSMTQGTLLRFVESVFPLITPTLRRKQSEGSRNALARLLMRY